MSVPISRVSKSPETFKVTKSPNVLKADTVDLVFDSNVIGFLQNFTAREDFAMKEIYGCGTSEPQVILPGFYKCDLSAQMAVFDMDFIFTSLVPYMGIDGIRFLSDHFKFDSYDGFIGSLGQDLAPYISGKKKTDKAFWDSFGVQAAKTIAGKVLHNKISCVVYFDIQLRDKEGADKFKWKDCVISSRTLSVSVNGILMMSDIQIKSRGRLL